MAAEQPQATRGADLAVATQITLAEALTGIAVTVDARVAQHCGDCDGSGAADGSEVTVCPGCGGAGRVRQVAQSVFGQVMRTGTCPRCEGSGREIETPCPRCDGDGRTIEEVALEVDVPAGIHDGQRIRSAATVTPARSEGHQETPTSTSEWRRSTGSSATAMTSSPSPTSP